MRSKILKTASLLLTLSLSALPFPTQPAYGNPPSAKEQPRHPAAPHAAPASKEQPHPAPALRLNPVVVDLETLSNSAEEVFELAMAGKMDRIGKKLDAVRKNTASLPVIQDESSALLLPRLTHTLSELEQAAAAKDRLQIMRFANRITIIAATVAVPYRPCVPTELSLLDYNAREMQIWSETKRTDKLGNIVIRMHLAWQTLMPKLVDRNATRELRRFSDTMGHLETAKAPEEFGRLSRQLTSELSIMKGVFQRPYAK